MHLRPIILILIALVIAGFATLTANRWLGNRIAPAETADITRVVAAANDISAGTRIDLTMVKMIDMSNASVPNKAIRDPQTVVGQYAVTNLLQGEPILEGRVAPQLGLGTLAARLGEGRRAITIGAGELAGLTGYLAPGSRVDLLAAGVQADGARLDSRTLLQNLTVMAVDPPMQPDKYDPSALRSVTLEVDPQQAEQIVRASEKSKLRMTLRNPDDRTSLNQDRQEPTIREIASTVETPTEPQYKEITVIRGQPSEPPVESVTRVLVIKP
jgi:pilus assembly protein CpaB